MRMGRSTLAIAAALWTLLAAPRLGRANEKQVCFAAADDAQQQRIDGKLKAARADCPALVRSDCEKWMTEVLALLPTIVLAVRDAQGNDVAVADVWIDGAAMEHGLDGKPIEVDPGMHTLRVVSSATGQSAEDHVLVREGEKGRAVSVTLGASNGVASSGGAATLPPAATSEAPRSGGEEPARSWSPSPWTWVLGGVGVVAVGVGAALELSVNAQASSLSGTCRHACTQDQVHPLVVQQQILGPIAFGVGAVSLAAAVFFLVRGAHDAGAGRSASAHTDVTVFPGGVVGRF
jgi:hypothetical protein